MQTRRAPYIICTLAGIGRICPAPGTAGSLLACMLFAITDSLILHFSLKIHIILPIICALITALGLWACKDYLKLSNKNDPQEVIIDEVAGQFIALYIISAVSGIGRWAQYLFGLALFRIFDIIKPWPICWVDKNVKGAPGVMLDDLIAGFAAGGAYASVIMAVERI